MSRIERLRYVHRIAPFLVCALLVASTARAIDSRGRGRADVVTAIDAMLADPALKGGIQGVVVQSLSTGKTWYERNSTLYFLPASNQKLLTTAAALGTLGPDWKFTTMLLRDGELDPDGTLRGSLYLKGSGDPLLEGKHLDAFAEAVKAAGIKRVQGKLVADETRFDRRRLGMGWEWDDLPYYYASEVSALNLNKNMVTVTVQAGENPGDPLYAEVSLLPDRVRLTVRGRTVEAGKPSSLEVSRELGENHFVVSGDLPAEKAPARRRSTGVTVVNPARFTAAYLQDRLKSLGVEVLDGAGEGATPAQGTVEVSRHTGEPLAEVLKKMNVPSDNLIAECLLKALGAEKSKAGIGSWKAGADAAAAWFSANGVDASGIVMKDGSGLSRHNYVTPASYASLLKTMHSHPYGKVFKESLPAPGQEGTLRNRPIGPNAKKSCRAKTGSLSNVHSLSGYVDTRSGEPLLFVILMNNHQSSVGAARGIQDKIVEYLASYGEALSVKR